jgi:hypothetical protein
MKPVGTRTKSECETVAEEISKFVFFKERSQDLHDSAVIELVEKMGFEQLPDFQNVMEFGE